MNLNPSLLITEYLFFDTNSSDSSGSRKETKKQSKTASKAPP